MPVFNIIIIGFGHVSTYKKRNKSQGGIWMMKIDIRQTTRVGLFSALTIMAICVFRIPGPGGNVYFHLGETVIITAAVLLGRKEGAFIGAVSAAIADLLLGAALWAPFSFVIHGFEGYLIGDLSDGKGGRRDIVAIASGIGVMIVGYTAVAGWLYGAAIMPVELMGDSMQGVIGAATAYPFLRALFYRFPKKV